MVAGGTVMQRTQAVRENRKAADSRLSKKTGLGFAAPVRPPAISARREPAVRDQQGRHISTSVFVFVAFVSRAVRARAK